MARTPLTDSEIAEALASLPGWEHSGGSLTKTFRLAKYLDGLTLATEIGQMAEQMDHHPMIVIGWKRVTVTFSTHDAGNKVTAWDVKAAAAVESLPAARSAT